MKLQSSLQSVEKKRTALTISYFLSFVALGMTTVSLGPALPYLAEQTGTLLAQISALFILHRIGYMAGSFLGGHLYDRTPGTTVMALMLLVVVAGMVAVPFSAVLYLLLIVIFCIGFAEGAVDVGGNILLVWTHKKRLPPLMNALHLAYGVGAFISPLIMGAVIKRTGGISWGYWILAVVILPVALVFLRLPSPRPESKGASDNAASGRWLFPVIITAFLLLCVGVEAAYGSWVYTFSLTKTMATKVTAAYLTSAYWGALTGGRLVFTLLATRLKPRLILLVNLAGCLVSLAILLIFPRSVAVLWIGSVGLGFFMSSIFPGTIILASQRIKLSGRLTGIFMVGASFGAMLLPWVIGQLFEEVGPQVVCIVLLIATGLAALIYTLLLAVRPGVSRRTL